MSLPRPRVSVATDLINLINTTSAKQIEPALGLGLPVAVSMNNVDSETQATNSAMELRAATEALNALRNL